MEELKQFLSESKKSTLAHNPAFYIISYLKLLKSIANVDRPFIAKLSHL